MGVPDVIYKDFVIHNDTTSIEIAKKELTYNAPIINRCSDYYIAVTRFSVSHMSIPLFFYSNTNNEYWVEINGVRIQLPYVSAGNYDSFGFVGKQPVFYYEQFVLMINRALLEAVTTAPNVVLPANAPFVVYAPNEEKFSLYFTNNAANVVPGGNIRFSTKLFQFIQFWRATYFGNYYEVDVRPAAQPPPTPTPNYIDYPNVYPANLNYYDDGTNQWYYIKQERSALYLLNQIQNIAFISNRIPTVKEFVPNLQPGDSHLLNSKSILSNFIPDLGQGRNLSEYQYYPQGFPFIIDMDSDQPLTTIDVQVYFVTKSGEFFQLYLEPGESIDIKFGFFKKSIFNNAYTK